MANGLKETVVDLVERLSLKLYLLQLQLLQQVTTRETVTSSATEKVNWQILPHSLCSSTVARNIFKDVYANGEDQVCKEKDITPIICIIFQGLNVLMLWNLVDLILDMRSQSDEDI